MDEPRPIARAVEVGRVLLKYRNAGIFSTIDPDDPLLQEAKSQDIPEGKPEEFVKDLEALGPTFVKIGQGLSTRPDFVPQPYIDALERMPAAARSQLARQLGRLVEEAGLEDEEPTMMFEDGAAGKPAANRKGKKAGAARSM